MQKDRKNDSGRVKWLVNVLKEPMKEPGAILNYDPINKKIILAQLPCHDSVSEAGSDAERREIADSLLEMVGVVVNAASTGASVSNGAWQGIAETLIRIRNLISTEYSYYDPDESPKREE